MPWDKLIGIKLVVLIWSWYFQPTAIIVPHQNTVRNIRQMFFNRTAKARPLTRTVILLSPDHFSPNQESIFFSDRNWTLSNGLLEYADRTGKNITSDFSRSNRLLTIDHGIYNILPEIKTYFPRARIVPLLVGERVSRKKLDALADRLSANCRWDCLVIASVDFSHYLPHALADVHDAFSLKALAAPDPDLIMASEADSPNSLYVTRKFSDLRKADNFLLFAHTNSAEIIGQRDTESTSHIMGWYRRGRRNNKFDTFTFLMTKNISGARDKPGPGERFFYGTEYVNENLTETFNLIRGLEIIPGGKASKVTREANKLTVNLGKDLAVAGIDTGEGVRIIFLPLGEISGQTYLQRGLEKTEYFDRLGIDKTGEIFIHYQM